jgi:UDP-sugar transporter A1/2/3
MPRKQAFWALLALIWQNTALVIVLKHSFRAIAKPYASSTAVLCAELLKLVLSSIVASREFTRPMVGLWQLVRQASRTYILFLPSVLYVVQNNLLFYGSRRLPPLVFIVCTQFKIFTTAVASRLLLGNRVSREQYKSLPVLLIGTVAVQYYSMDDTSFSHEGQFKEYALGVVALLIAACSSGTAGVLMEKIIKSSQDHSIWSRNLQLSLISVPFALLSSAVELTCRVERISIFSGFDSVVWLVVFLQASGGIIISYVMKFADNILKCLAVSLSICCCAVYSVVSGQLNFTASLAGGVLMVNIAVYQYSLNARQEKPIATATQNVQNV